MSRIIWSILLTIVVIPVSGQSLTLDSCYEKARRNYPLIRQYDLISKSEEYNVSNASKTYLPQVSLTGIAGYVIKGLPVTNPSGDAPDKFQVIGLGQINQTVWDGGATHAQKEIAKADAATERAQTDVGLYALHGRIDQLFFSILLLDQQQKQLALLKENMNRNLNAISLSAENGYALRTDVDEVKVELLKIDQRITDAEYTDSGYREMLSLMLGEKVSVQTTLEEPSVISLSPETEIKRPELSLYQFQQQQSAARLSLVKSGNMPKVGLLGTAVVIEPGIAFGPEKINTLALAGLSVSWNTGALYKSSNEKQLEKIRSETIKTRMDEFMFNTRLETSKQQSEISKQQSIIEKDRQIVALRSDIRKGYELKFKNGLCNMNDLIKATNNESESQIDMNTHHLQLLMNMYAFKTSTGN